MCKWIIMTRPQYDSVRTAACGLVYLWGYVERMGEHLENEFYEFIAGDNGQCIENDICYRKEWVLIKLIYNDIPHGWVKYLYQKWCNIIILLFL